MGTELIRSVTVQKNNVYLTSKSNNDDQHTALALRKSLRGLSEGGASRPGPRGNPYALRVCTVGRQP